VTAPLVPPAWSEKLQEAFRASPVKAYTLTGLVIIMVIAWVRVLVGGHTNPAGAQAAMTSVGTASTAVAVEPAPVHHSQDQGQSLIQWTRQPLRPISRNPFSIPIDFYPQDHSASSGDSAAGNSYWDLLRKSMSSRADQQEQRQILIDNIRLAAEALKLESTILGRTPSAMIDGQMVREGSVVSGFRVLKIESRDVVLDREGVKLVVIMN